MSTAHYREAKWRLHSRGLRWDYLLSDTGYSSGENYAYLEQKGITSYIPPHCTYKGGHEGFVYHKESDYWICRNNKRVTFRKVKVEKKNDIKKKRYFTTCKDCKGCIYRSECIGKCHERRIEITYYKDEYERAISRLNSPKGRYMKKKRHSTVEPVSGSLTSFYGLRKINTIGIEQANKVMLLDGKAYNLKKMLKFETKKLRNVAKQANDLISPIIKLIGAFLSRYKSSKIFSPVLLVKDLGATNRSFQHLKFRNQWVVQRLPLLQTAFSMTII